MGQAQGKMEKGKLYMIPNIISDGTTGQVVSPMVRETLTRLDYFLVENVRTARRYISSLSLGVTIESLTFEVLDRKTKEEEVEAMMDVVINGKDAGVISESGCPGVADPGAKAVAFAHRHGIQVVPLVGPSAILMALMASGFNGQSFVFHGYIPIDKSARLTKIREMEAQSKRTGQTQIFMDTPFRNDKLFDDLVATCQPMTQLSIGRDITGQEEFVKTNYIKTWKSMKPKLHKLPTIFVLFV